MTLGLLSEAAFGAISAAMLRCAVPLLFLTFVAALGGCNRPNWDTPQSAYQSIVRAIVKQDARTAWKGLSKQSQDALDARAKALSEAAGGALSEKGIGYFLGGGFTVPPLKTLEVLSQEGNEARLAVVGHDGARQEVRMVREENAWRLDVTPLLHEEGEPSDE